MQSIHGSEFMVGRDCKISDLEAGDGKPFKLITFKGYFVDASGVEVTYNIALNPFQLKKLYAAISNELT